jgi:integrase
MASAEKRGRFWRVRYKLPDGSVGSESGFETKKAAMEFGRTEEAKARHPELLAHQSNEDEHPEEKDGLANEPEADGLTVDQWIGTWETTQDVGISTEDTRKYLIKRFIRPRWGSWQLTDITTPEVTKWEKGLPAVEKISPRTAFDARSLLSTILGDAVAARPPLIPYNPALRPRNRGKRTGRRLLRNPLRTWATPLEAVLVAERAALLSGQDDDFVLLIAIAYTGMRWAEMIGLESEYCQRELINVEWQLREVNGRFHRLPPKDDSYRSLNWAPFLPVDLPPFLGELIALQAATACTRTCQCKADHGGSGHLLFTGPDGGHHRRSSYSRRIFRPSCDGKYAATNGTPEKLVIADMEAWPGRPVASWPLAQPGEAWQPPRGNGNKRLISEGTEATRCPACGRSVRWLASGLLATHKVKDDRCPGSGGIPAGDPALAAWLPVKRALTPHGLRHSKKTWMIEDGIPEILAELSLGHEVPGMRGLYSHVSEQMRQELKEKLQARWERSLKARFELDFYSPVRTLDELLTPLRTKMGIFETSMTKFCPLTARTPLD